MVGGEESDPENGNSIRVCIDQSYNRLQEVCFVSLESDLDKIITKWNISKPGVVFSFRTNIKPNGNDFKTFLLETVRLTSAAITVENTSENKLVKTIVKDIEIESDYKPVTIGIEIQPTEKIKDLHDQLNKDGVPEKWTTYTHLVSIKEANDRKRMIYNLNKRLSGNENPAPVIVFVDCGVMDEERASAEKHNLVCIDDVHSPSLKHTHWSVKNTTEDFINCLIKSAVEVEPKVSIKTVLKLASVLNVNLAELINSSRFSKQITEEDRDELIAHALNAEKWPQAMSLVREDINKNVLLSLHNTVHKTKPVATLEDIYPYYSSIMCVNISETYSHSNIRICLFLWAIENQKFIVAKGLWKQTKNMMAAALFAHQCLQKMEEDNNVAVDNLESIKCQADFYNDRAKEILTKCSSVKKEKTKKILVRKRDELGGKSLLQIAKYNKYFIAHDACHSKLNEIWFSPIDTQSKNPLCFLLCVFLPILAPALLQFRRVVIASTFQEKGCNEQLPKLPEYGKKVLDFLNAPVVKFAYYLMSLFTFLAFFAYDLTFGVSELSWNDGVIIAYVVSFSSEEIRQVYKQGPHYVRNVWNWIDISSLALFISGQSLTITVSSEGGRVLLAVSFIMFSIRLLQVFASFSQMGPLLIMMAKMLVDTVYFLGVLTVVVISYAVSSRAVLYPNSTFTWASLYTIFRKPYWHIFGELFLDELEGDTECGAFGTATNSTAFCPSTMTQYVIPVLLGVYMIIVQVLLINLLIAKFTVNSVHEETDIHWRYLGFELVNEYSDRTLIFPPFSFIYPVYLLVCFLREAC